VLKIDREKKQLTRLATPTFEAASILERQHLQEFIFRSPDDFFAELGLELFVIAKELCPSKTVDDRIDLAALDREGRVVVIELKRGNDKLQLLQAIAYAAMISQWEAEDLLALAGEQREQVEDFLADVEDINGEQRIILLAEAYDYEVLAAAEWLSERYGVDILCGRVALAVDEGSGQEYLTCNAVYPAPELAEQAVARGRRSSSGKRVKWSNWDDALAPIQNEALVGFFRNQLGAGQESYLPKRLLYYRLAGKRRWFLAAHTKRAYVWQMGRFDGDVNFWQQRLSEPDEVKLTKQGLRLRFFVTDSDDFARFHKAATRELLKAEWQAESAAGDDEPDE
jgi:hypothetical protein